MLRNCRRLSFPDSRPALLSLHHGGRHEAGNFISPVQSPRQLSHSQLGHHMSLILSESGPLKLAPDVIAICRRKGKADRFGQLSWRTQPLAPLLKHHSAGSYPFCTDSFTVFTISEKSKKGQSPAVGVVAMKSGFQHLRYSRGQGLTDAYPCYLPAGAMKTLRRC